MYLLGFDIGSSSIKAALVQAETGATLAIAHSPDTEMPIAAPQPGWAEQDPEVWWEQACRATRKLLSQQQVEPGTIKGIGIAYQMHGLVLVDRDLKPLRPSIIWCDSRAVEVGNRAFDAIGHEKCLTELLNSPGNFTASKLKWVKDNEPEIYRRIHKIMLPGDYIALRMTNQVTTSPSGLSEGIFWDFSKNELSGTVLNFFGFDRQLIPDTAPNLSIQGALTRSAAEEMGLSPGIPVAYRAGDQPNNALTLNVLQPGEVAATGGTSGVIYSVTDKPVFDSLSRVNSFLHVNHDAGKPRIGVLLCINGAGIQYNWMRQNMGKAGITYPQMEEMASRIPIGSEGLRILPFGNGAERMLSNRDVGAQILNLQFNRHTNAHFFRAALEGVAFSFAHGVSILKDMGMDISVMRVGNDNLFRSDIFSQTLSSLLGCRIQVVETTGAVGAAKAAGVATGIYSGIEEAMHNTEVLMTHEPQRDRQAYTSAFDSWEKELSKRF
ncbi:MAG: carbohydrate kinase [Lewinellaceae bacterium]|nr:carbohydrate kinase [Lewinellaceae bacterium]